MSDIVFSIRRIHPALSEAEHRHLLRLRTNVEIDRCKALSAVNFLQRREMDLVIPEQLVSENYLLRRADRAVDFGFNRLCTLLYCANNGRDAVDTVMLFRMLFVGDLYGIKSKARLEKEINYIMAYKWFCGL